MIKQRIFAIQVQIKTGYLSTARGVDKGEGCLGQAEDRP